MDKAVEKFRKRRQARLDARFGVERDPVAEYRKRRASRMDIRGEWNEEDHPRAKDGKFTSGAGGGRSKEFHHDPNERGGGSVAVKTQGGASYPKPKNGGSYDMKTLSMLEKKARAKGVDFDSLVKGLKEEDIGEFKDQHGNKRAALLGVSQKIDPVLGNRSEECEKIYKEKIERGKEINHDVVSVANEIGCGLHGLEYCFKEGKSTSGKIDRKREKDKEKADALLRDGKISEEEHGKMTSKTDEEYLSSFGDVVRYTVMSKHDDTVKAVEDTIKAFEKRGYECVELDNKWLPEKDKSGKEKPKEYAGVHMSFRAPNGEEFEVQVHSDESMDVKNVNHDLYEEQRDVKTSKDRKAELGKIMVDNVSKLPRPKGIMELKSFDKRKR